MCEIVKGKPPLHLHLHMAQTSPNSSPPALIPFSPLTLNLFFVNCTPISHPFTNCSLGSLIPHSPQNNSFHRMLPLSLKTAPQGLFPFVLLTLLLGESPLSPKLVLRDCFCHSPSLLLRESFPFPCSSEMAPFTPGMCSHPPQGSPPHPQNCPSRIAPLAAPSTLLLMEMFLYPQKCPSGLAPHHLQGSLPHGPSLYSPSGITPSCPKLSLSD